MDDGISWLEDPTSPMARVLLLMAPFCLINKKLEGMEEDRAHNPLSAIRRDVEADSVAFIFSIPPFPDNEPEKENMLPECEKSEEKEYCSISLTSVVVVFSQNEVEPKDNEEERDIPSLDPERELETGPSLKEAETLA